MITSVNENKRIAGIPAHEVTRRSDRMYILVSLDISKWMWTRDNGQMNKVLTQAFLKEEQYWVWSSMCACCVCVKVLGQRACLLCMKKMGEEQPNSVALQPIQAALPAATEPELEPGSLALRCSALDHCATRVAPNNINMTIYWKTWFLWYWRY